MITDKSETTRFEKYFFQAMSVFSILLWLIIAAAISSVVAAFTVGLFIEWQFTLEFIPKLLFGALIFGSIIGPLVASPMLLFIYLPWFYYLKKKEINNFYLWVAIPACISFLYSFISGIFFSVIYDDEIVATAFLFTIAGSITSFLMYKINNSSLSIGKLHAAN